jgi:hypothetical protein
LLISPNNGNVAEYNLPQSRSDLVDRFEGRYEGVTVQVADFMAKPDWLTPDRGWRDLMVGNMFSVAGVESVNAYSGIGYTAIDAALCLQYNGGTCPNAWSSLWQRPAGSDRVLADLMNVQTVILERDFVNDADTPPGWSITDRTSYVTVFSRDEPLEFPEGRVSATGSAVEVTADEVVGKTAETVRFDSGSGDDRSIVFARLAWPGYSATIGGEPIPVAAGPAGLLEITVPPDIDGGELRIAFTPPGLVPGLIAFVIGLLTLVALALLRRWQLRRATEPSSLER